MGYDKYVRIAFEDMANVYYHEENSRFTTYIIRNLFNWKEELGIGENIDLVYWNAGLWDDLVMLDGKHLISIEDYKKNIERICLLIKKLFPNAKMSFATSTPVIEELFTDYKRYNSDTEKYNEAAADIVGKMGGNIDDLYSVMKECPIEYHSDLTHYYTKEGTRVIANKVIAHIEEVLAIKAKKLDYDKLFAEKSEITGM